MAKNYNINHYVDEDDIFEKDQFRSSVLTNDGSVGIHTEWVSTDNEDGKTGYWQTTVFRTGFFGSYERGDDVYVGSTVDFERSYGGIDEAKAVHDAMCQKWDGYQERYADIDDNGKIVQEVPHPQTVGLSEPVEFTENSKNLDGDIKHIVYNFAFQFIDYDSYVGGPHTSDYSKIDDLNDLMTGFNEKLASLGYFLEEDRPALAVALDNTPYLEEFKETAAAFIDAYKDEIDVEEEYEQIGLDEYDGKISTEEMNIRNAENAFKLEKADAVYSEAKQGLHDILDHIYSHIDDGTTTDENADESNDRVYDSAKSSEGFEGSDVKDENKRNYSVDSYHPNDGVYRTGVWSTTLPTEDRIVEVRTAWKADFQSPATSGYWKTSVLATIEGRNGVEPVFDEEYSHNGIDEAEAVHNAMCEKWDGYEGGFVSIDDLKKFLDSNSDDTGNKSQEIGIIDSIVYTENVEQLDERSNGVIADLALNVLNNVPSDSAYEVKLASIGYYNDGDRPALADAVDHNENFKDFKAAADNYIDAYKNQEVEQVKYEATEKELQADLKEGKIGTKEWQAELSEARISLREAKSECADAKQELNDFYDCISEDRDDTDIGTTADERGGKSNDVSASNETSQDGSYDVERRNYSEDSHYNVGPYGTDEWHTVLNTKDGEVMIETVWSDDNLQEPSGHWETMVFGEDGIVDIEFSYGGLDEAAAVHDAMCEKWDGYKGGFVTLDDFKNVDYSNLFIKVQELGITEPIKFTEKVDHLDERCDKVIKEICTELITYRAWDVVVEDRLTSIGYYKDGERPALAEAMDRNQHFNDFKETAYNFIDASAGLEYEQGRYDTAVNNIQQNYNEGKISSEECKSELAESRAELREAKADYEEAKQELQDFADSIEVEEDKDNIDTGTTANEGSEESKDTNKSDTTEEKQESQDSKPDSAADENTDETKDTHQGVGKNVDKENEVQNDKELAEKLASIKDEILEAVNTIVSDMIDELIKELGNDVTNDDDNIEAESKTDDEVEEISEPDNVEETAEKVEESEEYEIEIPPIDTEEETDDFEERFENFDDEYNDYYEDWGDDL